MARRIFFIKAALVLIVVWSCVWGVRAYAGSQKVTAERVNAEVAAANFTDASSGELSAAEIQRRDGELRKIATLVNKLDFNEREKNRADNTGENFFRKLTAGEKNLFVDLTIMESMGKFMEALDKMKPEQRKQFVERGLKEIKEGKTGADMARADALGGELLEKITTEGMKAYFQKSSSDTKLDLAPLMEAMNETMQGLRGNEFGPRP
jgi:hypothetical protein